MFGFILTIVGISLSGVMAPGPITAATLAAGARRRHAGAWICAGHIFVELPLVLLVAAGLGTFLRPEGAARRPRAGGGRAPHPARPPTASRARKTEPGPAGSLEYHPFWIGVVLSGANPYFVLWWATVGLTLTSRAMDFGLVALVLFALIHWLCDLGWLEVLSWGGYKGSQAFGHHSQTVLSVLCGVMLLGFGVKFICDGLPALSL